MLWINNSLLDDEGISVVTLSSVTVVCAIGQVLFFEQTGEIIGDWGQNSLRYSESGDELMGEFNRSMKEFEDIAFLKNDNCNILSDKMMEYSDLFC